MNQLPSITRLLCWVKRSQLSLPYPSLQDFIEEAPVHPFWRDLLAREERRKGCTGLASGLLKERKW